MLWKVTIGGLVGDHPFCPIRLMLSELVLELKWPFGFCLWLVKGARLSNTESFSPTHRRPPSTYHHAIEEQFLFLSRIQPRYQLLCAVLCHKEDWIGYPSSVFLDCLVLTYLHTQSILLKISYLFASFDIKFPGGRSSCFTVAFLVLRTAGIQNTSRERATQGKHLLITLGRAGQKEFSEVDLAETFEFWVSGTKETSHNQY